MTGAGARVHVLPVYGVHTPCSLLYIIPNTYTYVVNYTSRGVLDSVAYTVHEADITLLTALALLTKNSVANVYKHTKTKANILHGVKLETEIV